MDSMGKYYHFKSGFKFINHHKRLILSKRICFELIEEEHTSCQKTAIIPTKNRKCAIKAMHQVYMCHGQKSRFIGDGHPTFNRNPYNGYINPYYWVDDHPLLYGNNGSLDPGTHGSWLAKCRKKPISVTSH